MIMRAGKASLKSFRAVWKGGLRKRLVWTTAAVHKQSFFYFIEVSNQLLQPFN